MKSKSILMGPVMVSSFALLAQGAHAQDAAAVSSSDEAESVLAGDTEGLRDIVVTAERRESSVQRTPLAITAVQGDSLVDRQITSIVDLAPSLAGVSFGQNQGYARIAIRGVGYDSTLAAQEARVAYHLDGVYISRPAATLATFFDVNRIEVVRGPQGTLYGRNATGGAINVISNAPASELGGYARLTVGNYDTVNAEGAITGSISGSVAARLAFTTTNRAGYGRNLLTGESINNEHTYAGRASLLFEPSASFSYLLSADYSRQDDAGHFIHFLGARGNPDVIPISVVQGARTPSNPRDAFSDFTPANEREYYGITGTGEVQIGTATLTAITAYRDAWTSVQNDGDGTERVLSLGLGSEEASQFSQEIRLAGETGPFNYVFGGYYFRETVDGARQFSPLRSPAPPNALSMGLDYFGRFETYAYAAFGQIDFDILDSLTLTLGGRYSHEKKSVDQAGSVQLTVPFDPAAQFAYTIFQEESATFKSFTPKVTITYNPTPGLLAYATYAAGFKSGGYTLAAFVPPLKPEKLDDYEVGIKVDLLDRRLRVNVAAFYYDYTNLQVQIIQGVSAIPLNAASAIVKGAEFEVTAKPFANFQVEANASFLDSEYRDFATADSARPSLGVIDLSGNQLTQAPSYTINLAAQYIVPLASGELIFRGESRWVDRVYFTAFNRPELSEGSNAKFNAFATYEDESGWSASAFVRNLTDRRTVSVATVTNSFLGSPVVGSYDPPRTFGISLGYAF